ncbi:recombinase family protein [Geobacter grbiciae]|uniref:recombinase family protein n=1 Tax=Geobacter grbiciae TaxID=155042 RepID=UPI001C00E72D|nr:recombinase family protein [Geobacter grbiciae]MBT1073973.1 recombinase family protein [Geobacter grbiciae]
MRAALYARVSTTDKGQDAELQLTELRRFAEARGWLYEEFVDEGISGSKNSRPALDRLIKTATKRQVDCVIVWKLDRLGRSLSHLLRLLNDFQSLDVAFISLRESIDMTTPSGKLMAHLLGAFAEYERELIRERVKAGIDHARKKGKRVGRKPTPQAEQEAVTNLMSAEPTASVRAIAKKLKMSPSTVHRIIQQHRFLENN